ncbi:hypothetical protein [Paraburkholderia saeva]|jgi:uncharacterized protein YhhL (DUF1145 family)|uniref:hypothetical protein n=1 Tax=Paraburkholderia saeva TaxID=2777537 RepID=UPI001E1266F7|nr:hypothetical protein [Paraburkholderia saeva]CAG4917289.1 hypothetical protein R52603_04536 [Paraburkholderia saeva]
MLRIVKLACLVIYGFALASLVVPGLASGFSRAVENVAIVFLVIHAFEVVFAFGRVRTYHGPLMLSVLFTILFGVLHLMPLRTCHSRGAEQ